MDTAAILNIPTYEHGVSFHLFVFSLIHFSNGLPSSGYKAFISLVKFILSIVLFGNFPVALVIKNLPANAGDISRQGCDPWVVRIPWRRKWQPTSVFLPGESHGQRGLADYSPSGHKESEWLMGLSIQHSTFYYFDYIGSKPNIHWWMNG